MGYSLEQNTFIIMSYYRYRGLNEDEDELWPDLTTLVASLKENRQGDLKLVKTLLSMRTRMEQSPKKYLSKLSLQSGVPYSTCQKIVKEKLHMHPYKISLVQEL
ncbi:hypothetical protein Zmor_018101 [Zophobas morio]|uniref:Uncharacterized protein n=1 Tax=Zophobas morio TaxID=2755281 RepID=A0AA38ICM8_9CUCU|nr:hypothetical protein Zmor_018101 [Zophobas morio]